MEEEEEEEVKSAVAISDDVFVSACRSHCNAFVRLTCLNRAASKQF